MDWCNTVVDGKQLDPRVVYHNMSVALNGTQRKIWFNLCEWGVMQPWLWAFGDGQSWRTGSDHHDVWSGSASSTSAIIEANAALSPFSGHFGWNDMDFLMTGGQGCNNDTSVCPGQTWEEYRTEFSMWCLLDSPLLVATDIRPEFMTAQKKAILFNNEVIAVNQDRLGKQGKRVGTVNCPGDNTGALTCQIWSKPLADGTFAIVLYNIGQLSHSITVDFSLVGFRSAQLRDLWAHKDLGLFTNSFTATVPSHGVVMVKASKQT